MTTLRVAVRGIGAWSAGHPGWPVLRAALRTGTPATPATEGGPRRPAPLLLPPAERRRVPDGVAVALEVAREALDGTDVDRSTLASVFASSHGELAIVDYLCTTLASDPTALSPTRFHHSVHNAAAGYWSIATTGVGPSTSLAAGDASFALGLLEAASQVVAEAAPVLLVTFDTPTVGLLATAAPDRALFGAAWLLVPACRDTVQLDLAWTNGPSVMPLPRRAEMRALAIGGPAASALALLEALAVGDATPVRYPVDAGSSLVVAVVPAATEARSPIE